MNIYYGTRFKKHYAKRIKSNESIKKRLKERVKLFLNNPGDETLHNHSLTGDMKEYRAFSVTGDIRIIYRRISADTVEFLDIGTHSQVYS